jgi:hypothetical protein
MDDDWVAEINAMAPAIEAELAVLQDRQATMQDETPADRQRRRNRDRKQNQRRRDLEGKPSKPDILVLLGYLEEWDRENPGAIGKALGTYLNDKIEEDRRKHVAAETEDDDDER